MSEIDIDVALGYLQSVLGKLCDKHFVAKQELNVHEQNLLNDLHTVAVHAVYKELIRKHFSIK